MSFKNYWFTLILIAISYSCNKNKSNQIKIVETASTDLKIDHFNIWVKNPEKAKEKLLQIGFTAVPDSLSDVHHGQGTAGKYFYFLNSYLELIYVNNKKELEQNQIINKDLDFSVRSNFDNNGASPFSIALKIKDYKTDKIPFQKVKYHQDWMQKDANIFAAKNSKINIKEPSIFVVYPEIESRQYTSISDLQKISNEYAFVRNFYKHKNGAKKITQIKISSTTKNLQTETIKAINSIKEITIIKGDEHIMELFFDNNSQKKTIDLRPELPLIIHL